MKKKDIVVKPEVGTLVIFPPTKDFMQGVEPTQTEQIVISRWWDTV